MLSLTWKTIQPSPNKMFYLSSCSRHVFRLKGATNPLYTVVLYQSVIWNWSGFLNPDSQFRRLNDLSQGSNRWSLPRGHPPKKIIFAKKWFCRTRSGIFKLFHQERKSLIAARWHRVQHSRYIEIIAQVIKIRKRKKVFFPGSLRDFFFRDTFRFFVSGLNLKNIYSDFQVESKSSEFEFQFKIMATCKKNFIAAETKKMVTWKQKSERHETIFESVSSEAMVVGNLVPRKLDLVLANE